MEMWFEEADAGTGMNPKTWQHHKTGEIEEEEEYGMRKTDRKQDPREPNAEAQLEHEKTHLPFRSGCRHCVRGRGKEEACRVGKRSHDAAEVHMDFMFMGDEGSDKTLAMLVAHERSRGMTLATVAPRKSSGEWLGKRVMAFMRGAGCEVEAMVMKTDLRW